MVQAFSEERHLRRDGQELLGYEKINRFRPGTNQLTNIAQSNPDLIDVYYPTLIGSALFEQERKRTGGLVSVEFKPTDDFKFSLTGFSSRMKADNYNRNYMLWGSRILAQGSGQAPAPGYVVRNTTVVPSSSCSSSCSRVVKKAGRMCEVIFSLSSSSDDATAAPPPPFSARGCCRRRRW